MVDIKGIFARPPINPNTNEIITLNKKKYQYSLLLARPLNAE
jgi:hypothetical protein